MTAYDLYDVLGSAAYGLDPRTKLGRADAFLFKARTWLDQLPADTSNTVKAVARQFGVSGTDALENRYIFDVPEVRAAGGLAALRPTAVRERITDRNQEADVCGVTVTQGSSATVWPNSRLGDTCKLLNGDPYKPRDWSKSGTPDHSYPKFE